jgi:desampylase
MIAAFVLPPALRAQIEGEARAACPHECCGLIEGARDGDAVRTIALHPARNLSLDADRFDIDHADHARAQRMARENGHVLIGCYHSHPDGSPQISKRDQEGAMDDGFVWLICAVSDDDAQIGAFVWESGQFRALDIRQSRTA